MAAEGSETRCVERGDGTNVAGDGADGEVLKVSATGLVDGPLE
jgi:hypothetical protein